MRDATYKMLSLVVVSRIARLLTDAGTASHVVCTLLPSASIRECPGFGQDWVNFH